MRHSIRFSAAHLLLASAGYAAEIKVELSLSSDVIAPLGSVAVRVKLSNESDEAIKLSHPICVDEFYTLSFLLRGPDEREYRNVPTVDQFMCELTLYPPSVFPGKSSREEFTLLAPTEYKNFFDVPGAWLLRVEIVGHEGVTGVSEPTVVFVRRERDAIKGKTPLKLEHAQKLGPEESLLEINRQVVHAFQPDSRDRPIHEELAKWQTMHGVSAEMRKLLRWLAAVAKVREAELDTLAADHRAAVAVWKQLDDASRPLMSLQLARALYHQGQDKLARAELAKLPAGNRQRRNLEYEFLTKRYHDAEMGLRQWSSEGKP